MSTQGPVLCTSSLWLPQRAFNDHNCWREARQPHAVPRVLCDLSFLGTLLEACCRPGFGAKKT